MWMWGDQVPGAGAQVGVEFYGLNGFRVAGGDGFEDWRNCPTIDRARLAWLIPFASRLLANGII